MNDNFARLREFVDSMNSSNSSLHKKKVLASYTEDEYIKNILLYTYHPYKQFGVTSASLKKWDNPTKDERCDNIFNVLDRLVNREMTGHHALSCVKAYIDENAEYADLIYQIIDRNLETRATASLINSVIPGLIPTFNVALAYDATKVKKINLLDGTWLASRKLDGVRCITIISGTDITFYSRNGKEFDTLGKVEDEIRELGLTDCVLDGEICIQSEDGADDFQGVIKQIKRKDHTIDNPKYWVFDQLTLDEFWSGAGTTPLSERLSTRFKFNGASKIITQLDQVRILTENDLATLKAQSKDSDWEGLIARRDVGYEGDRSKNMLKLKEFFEAEYTVTGTIMEPQRVIVDGLEVQEDMLSAVTILHKGDQVKVGSGFTINERRQYFADPSQIVGKTITVSYFEETIDQDGKNSLRFPIFKWNHGLVRST